MLCLSSNDIVSIYATLMDWKKYDVIRLLYYFARLDVVRRVVLAANAAGFGGKRLHESRNGSV